MFQINLWPYIIISKIHFQKKKLVNKDVKQIEQSFKDVYTYFGMYLILPDMYTNAQAQKHTYTHTSNTVNEISFPN